MGENLVDAPDARRVEWMNYSDRTGECTMPLQRSLANVKREISEKN